MRLLSTYDFEMREFWDDNTPQYAILSHTWEEEEVSFQDLADLKKASQMKGFRKIRGCCELAKKQLGGVEWVWIDTCCIDKSSSAELSEAINSMFRWYQNAFKCYAFLADVPSDDNILSQGSAFCKSRWFTRGWTLQELIAPNWLVFYSLDWKELGDRAGLSTRIASITGITAEVLVDGESTERLRTSSIAQKMSWASKRCTTRLEDIAYCLMGLFDVNMPLLYGEGTKAFLRLQEEILKRSNDHTLFAWLVPQPLLDHKILPRSSVIGGFLAPSPLAFRYSDPYEPINNPSAGVGQPYTMTNMGLCIDLPIFEIPGSREDQCVAILNCVSSLDVQGTVSDLIGIHVTLLQYSYQTQSSKRVCRVARDPHQRPIRVKVVGWSAWDYQQWAVVEWNTGIGPPVPPVKAFMCTLYILQNEPLRYERLEHTASSPSQQKHIFASVGDKMDAQMMP